MPLIPRLQLVFLCAMLLLVDASFGQQHQASDPLVVADDNRTPTWEETLTVFEELASGCEDAVSYTHLRAHETLRYLVCRLLLEKKKT